MPLTRTAARDQIAALVKTVADGLSDFVGIWDDTRTDIPDAQASPLPSWARIIIRHGPGAQRGLADISSVRRYTQNGILTIQLFTPSGDGLTLADTISEAFLTGVSGVSTPGGVWFKNQRSVEVGNDGPWFQTNVIAEFEYDQIR